LQSPLVLALAFANSRFATITTLQSNFDETHAIQYYACKRCPMSAAHNLPAMEPTLFNPQTGRLDAGRIAREFNVPVAIIAEAIGRRAPGVRKSPDASSLQGELRRLYRIWVALIELYAGDKTNARIFLNAPNRNLENHAPIEFIQNGDLTPLELFVDAMSARQPG
jgi:hypothetical protein